MALAESPDKSTSVGAEARPATHLRRRVLPTVVRHAVLILCALAFVLPLYWMISTSLKENQQVLAFPPAWIPNPVAWSNYPDALDTVPFIRYAANTTIITLSTVVGALISNTLVAYGFAQLEWKGRDALFIVVLATMMLPYQVTMIPLFLIFSDIGWTNTFLPLIVPEFFGNAFYIFLLRQFFKGIPRDYTDAARIEGASELRILYQVIVPLAKPALISVALFQFLFAWNDFLAPLLYLTDRSNYTLSLGLANMQSALGLSQFGQIMAVSTMTVLPVIIVFISAQRFFIQGITMSGIKG